MWPLRFGMFVLVFSSVEATLDLRLIEKTIQQFEMSQGGKTDSGTRFVILLPAGQSLTIPSKSKDSVVKSEPKQELLGSTMAQEPRLPVAYTPDFKDLEKTKPLSKDTGTDFLSVPHREMPDFLKNTGNSSASVVLSPQAVGPRSFVTEVPTPTLEPRIRTYTNYWKHPQAFDRVPQPEAYSWHQPPAVPQMPSGMHVPSPRQFSASVRPPSHGTVKGFTHPVVKSGPYLPPMPDFGCNILLGD